MSFPIQYTNTHSLGYSEHLSISSYYQRTWTCMQVPDWAGKPQEGPSEIKCANLSSSEIKDYQERNKILLMVGHIIINQN